MKIVSTTLTGNREDQIGDALRSVAKWVDRCIVIPTCPILDDTIEVARRVCGDKLHVQPYEPIARTDSFHFGDARNFALACAGRLGAAWALTIDTDERLHVVTSFGLDQENDLILCQYEDKSYAKERFIRIPPEGHWVGPTHEGFVGWKKRTTLENTYFSELPKTREQLTEKFRRDEKELEDYVRGEGRNDGRFWFYLGNTRKDLDKFDRAIDAYVRCANMPGWDEQRAWACFQASICQVRMNRYEEAIGICTYGMSKHAGVSELAWQAGWCNWKLGRYQQAIYLSKIALVWGKSRHSGLNYEDSYAETGRVGFVYPPALYEAPWQVLMYSYQALGNVVEANRCRIEFELAWASREGRTIPSSG
jgi:tetratricopeptide (TPR) repeat protein